MKYYDTCFLFYNVLYWIIVNIGNLVLTEPHSQIVQANNNNED